MEKLSFEGIKNSLSRDDMRKIMAGSGGNIYCLNGSVQAQCHWDDLTDCLDACVDAWGTNCNGCAQFPE
jgi:hypothetical protein